MYVHFRLVTPRTNMGKKAPIFCVDQPIFIDLPRARRDLSVQVSIHAPELTRVSDCGVESSCSTSRPHNPQNRAASISHCKCPAQSMACTCIWRVHRLDCAIGWHVHMHQSPCTAAHQTTSSSGWAHRRVTPGDSGGDDISCGIRGIREGGGGGGGDGGGEGCNSCGSGASVGRSYVAT